MKHHIQQFDFDKAATKKEIYRVEKYTNLVRNMKALDKVIDKMP